MLNRRQALAAAALAFAAGIGPAAAQDRAQDKAPDRLMVVATFSILGDLVRNVGGDRVEVASLVGPNGDAHVYAPTPVDAKTIGAAKLVFTNGLGFEGWMTRLVKASGTKAAVVVATKGITPRRMAPGEAHGHDPAGGDPHAWQSVANAKVYVSNIRDALVKADPAGKAVYDANASTYLAKLDVLEQDVVAALAKIPAERRRIITTHDAFGYFGQAYKIDFIAPQGVSTESEVSARDLAAIITQIRTQKIPAVFLENVTDPRILERISKETGAKIGGTLYSDALTDRDGPAATYIDMMRHNVGTLGAALMS